MSVGDLWAPFVRDIVSRDAVTTALRNEMAKTGASCASPIKVPSDMIKTHLPVLVLAVIAVGISCFIHFDMAEPRASYVAIGYNVSMIVSLGAPDLLARGPGSIRMSTRT